MQNYSKSIQWLVDAAKEGLSEAQNELGNSYYRGDGAVKDFNEAVKWYRRAAEQGNADAQNSLGYCYYDGGGGERNFSAAVEWFRKAAEQGNAVAQYNLGICYYNGNGVEQNREKAVMWLRKSADQGYDKANKFLEEIEENKARSRIEGDPLDYMKYYRYTRPDMMPVELRRGDAHYTNSLYLYLAGCRRFGWDERSMEGFGQRRPMYAEDATPEGYAVWCPCNSNLTMSAAELKEKGIQNRIGDRYIEERVCNPWSHSLGQDKPDEVRVAFVRVKRPRESGFIYMFYGVIRRESIRIVDDIMFRTFELISDKYPDSDIDPLG